MLANPLEQHYHSLHARGEDVEAVLAAYEAEKDENLGHEAEDAEDPLNGTDHGWVANDLIELDGDLEEGELNYGEDELKVNETRQNRQLETPQEAGANVLGTTMPQSLVMGCEDEALKNLMMAWYYAGYYTGLHEGKQQTGQGTMGRHADDSRQKRTS